MVFFAALITDPALEEPARLGVWSVATMNQTRTHQRRMPHTCPEENQGNFSNANSHGFTQIFTGAVAAGFCFTKNQGLVLAIKL